MNNLKKIGLTALGTALVTSSAVAGSLDVTGTAGITYVGNSGLITVIANYHKKLLSLSQVLLI